MVLLGVPQQVVAERRARAEHRQQPHRGALVVDEVVEQGGAVLDPVGEVREVGQRLVRVGGGREQVHQLVRAVAQPGDAARRPLGVGEPEPRQPPRRGGDPSVRHDAGVRAGAGSAHTAANRSASTRQVARRSSRAATTSAT